MLKSGILNPHLLSLLARIRHTNRLVIADRGFPFWPGIETIDLTLVDGIPTVQQVLTAILPDLQVGPAWMAQEFVASNLPPERDSFVKLLEQAGAKITYEPHVDFKRRVPGAIGLIRTADTLPYSNVILESA